MQLILNELSLMEIPNDIQKGISLFEKLISTYSKAIKSKYNFNREIITFFDLNNVEIAKNYYVAQWRNQSPNRLDRELLRRFSGMCDRQIILDSHPCEEKSELSCEKGKCRGLLLAYHDNEVGLSLLTDDFWKSSAIKGKLYCLTKDTSTEVQIHNLSDSIQLNEQSKILDLIYEQEMGDISTGKQLADKIHIYFPTLIFSEIAIKKLINEVQSQHLAAIKKKLCEIENYFKNWDKQAIKAEDFRSKMTPQSVETLKKYKKEHSFVMDGKEVIASYHVRYTGGIPGRIYFHPDHISGKALICSLTTKLPTVTD